MTAVRILKVYFPQILSTEGSWDVWALLYIACPLRSDLHVNWFTVFIAKNIWQRASVCDWEPPVACYLHGTFKKFKHFPECALVWDLTSLSSSAPSSLHPSICFLCLPAHVSSVPPWSSCLLFYYISSFVVLWLLKQRRFCRDKDWRGEWRTVSRGKSSCSDHTVDDVLEFYIAFFATYKTSIKPAWIKHS